MSPARRAERSGHAARDRVEVARMAIDANPATRRSKAHAAQADGDVHRGRLATSTTITRDLVPAVALAAARSVPAS
jgi:hypothetical protein